MEQRKTQQKRELNDFLYQAIRYNAGVDSEITEFVYALAKEEAEHSHRKS